MKTSRRVTQLLGCTWMVAACLICAGCDDPKDDEGPEQSAELAEQETTQPDTSSTSNIEYPEGEAPTPETVLAKSGALKVTFADYQTFLDRTALFRSSSAVSPEDRKAKLDSDQKTKPPKGQDEKVDADDESAMPSAEELADPRLQVQTTRQLLRHKVIDHLADHYEVKVSEPEIIELLESTPPLNQYVVIEATGDAGRRKLSVHDELPGNNSLEDLREIARQQILRRKLEEAILAKTGEDTLWKWYKQQHNRAAIIYVERLNVPDSEKIDRFVANHKSAIREHYEKNKQNYRVPRLAEITELFPRERSDTEKSGDSKQDESKLRTRLEKAAAKLKEGVAPEEVAESFDLIFQGTRKVGQRELRDAFRMEVGEAAYRMQGPGAPHVWLLRDIQTSHPQKLDSSLERQIASNILQKRGVVPSVEKQLKRALDVMGNVSSQPDGTLSTESRKKVLSKLKEAGFEPNTTELFTRGDQGYVPGIGLAESVTHLAFSLDGDQPVAEEPVVDRQHAYAVRLLDREHPSREDFEAKTQQVRQKYREHVRGRIVDAAVTDWFRKYSPEMNLEPLRVKYGIHRKKR